MDAFGDHALACPCKGDHTSLHNRVSDITFEDACEARMAPEHEKPGLLPSRPNADGIHTNLQGEARRPADVWLPRAVSGTIGAPEVLDFALTSGLRNDNINKAVESPHLLYSD